MIKTQNHDCCIGSGFARMGTYVSSEDEVLIALSVCFYNLLLTCMHLSPYEDHHAASHILIS